MSLARVSDIIFGVMPTFYYRLNAARFEATRCDDQRGGIES